MADKKKTDNSVTEQPEIVSGPISVPVEIDPVAYGVGREVHYERDTEKDR